MTNPGTTDLWMRFARNLGRVSIAAVVGLTLIALPACGDDGHHDGEGHAMVEHEQMDEHTNDHGARPMDDQAEHDTDVDQEH